MNMIDMPVTLIVKAPNQQVEDQTIQCELNWTIRKLKGYLSEVYPSKPRTEDQKLIYSGQLLNDSVTLKDILRWYEGQDTHTLHLVCMPSHDSLRWPTPILARTAQRMSNNRQNPDREENQNTEPTESSGLRQRLTAQISSPSQAQQSTGPAPDPRAAWAAALAPSYGYDPNNVAHQLALMQHAYAQYMSQYMQLVASGAISQGGFVPSGTPPQPQPVAEPVNQPQVVDQPNNDNAVAEVEEEEDRFNRDWLYWFYTMSRVMVLFSIVYFYSSPTRFLIVSVLAIIMYLYHKGFLHVQAARLVVENNNEAPEPADNNNRAEGVPERGSGGVAGEEEPAPEPERPSLLALTWTFFTSFFASLIPEHQGAL